MPHLPHLGFCNGLPNRRVTYSFVYCHLQSDNRYRGRSLPCVHRRYSEIDVPLDLPGSWAS